MRSVALLDPDRSLSAVAAEGRRSILIVTDAWHPQVNGVVMTLTHLAERWGVR